jgi:hypothetical protein
MSENVLFLACMHSKMFLQKVLIWQIHNKTSKKRRILWWFKIFSTGSKNASKSAKSEGKNQKQQSFYLELSSGTFFWAHVSEFVAIYLTLFANFEKKMLKNRYMSDVLQNEKHVGLLMAIILCWISLYRKLFTMQTLDH